MKCSRLEYKMAFYPVALLRANKHWFTKESNLDRFVYTIDLWLRISGLGITKDNLALTFRGFLLLLISTVPFFVSCLLGVLYRYYYLVKVLHEANDTTGLETANFFIPFLFSFNRALWLACNRREICRVVTLAQELGQVTMPRAFWMLTTLYVCINYSCTIHKLILGPLLHGERVLPEEHLIIPGLEDTIQTPDYEITYTCIVVGFYTILPIVVCFFTLYIGLTGHITGHYNKLRLDFENLLQEVTADSHVIDVGILKMRLAQLIEQHCKIIEVTANVKVLYNTLFGFEFGCVTVGIGVLLFQISRSGFSNLIEFITYYAMTLLVFCIPGERMRAASDSLPSGIWFSGWEAFGPRERMSVLMIMRLAQKEQTLTAATFVPVTHNTLMSIIKTCFSIYAAFDAANGK